jgi:hypothetical protein
MRTGHVSDVLINEPVTSLSRVNSDRTSGKVFEVEYIEWVFGETASIIMAASIPVIRSLFCNPCRLGHKGSAPGNLGDLISEETLKPGAGQPFPNEVPHGARGRNTDNDVAVSTQRRQPSPLCYSCRESEASDTQELLVHVIKPQSSGDVSVYEMELVIGQAE